MLTDNYLVLCDSLYNKAPTHYLPLTFSVKFETLFYALNSIGVIFYLSIRKNPSVILHGLLLSGSNDNNATKKSLFTHNLCPSSISGWKNSKRKSTKGTFTNFSRLKKKLEKALLPLSTSLKDSETTRWSPSKLFLKKSNTRATRAETHFKMKSAWCAISTTAMWWNSKVSTRQKIQFMSFWSIFKAYNWTRCSKYFL
jgi:hypothetical protein